MSLPPEVPQPPDRPNAQPATEQQLREVEREMTGFERATLRWARVAVIMSGLAALFVCLQWWEMHQGGIDTHALAEATGDMANAASDQADAAQQFSDTTEDINRGIGNAVGALDAANKTNRNALESVQRAFVGIVGVAATKRMVHLPSGITQGQWKVSGEWLNSGNTPAPRALAYFNYKALPEEPNGEVFVGDQKAFSETNIGPKESRDTGHVNVAESAIPVDPKDVAHQYFWGWMVYYDVFSRLHLSEFCWNLTSTALTTDGRQAEFSTKACQHHNCSDAYCRDYKKMLTLASDRLTKPN